MTTPTSTSGQGTQKVHIFDTTLRDGEQAPGCSMTTPEKLRMAAKLAELGVDIMEAGFPVASTGDFEAVEKVSREVAVKVAALARATTLDVERAAKALEGAKVAPRIHVFLATSDVHLKYKLKKTRAQVLAEAAAAVALAK
jgi:2-isopropylmalate synthase